MRVTVLLLCVISSLAGAVVLDRIAAIIGNHVVKASDIDLDLRVTNFLNQTPLVENPEARRSAADRLIDQQIIRNELGSGGYSRATDGDALALLQQVRKSRFGDSSARMRAALERYGLSEAQIQAQLLWQLTVLRFIDQRFRPGVLVTDEDVRAYFDQHHVELAKEHPKNSTFEALSQQIRTSLEGDKINREFESWLEGARKRSRVEYRDVALNDAGPRNGASK